MLKGHVQIDIHNHNSGFTERYEQDNMVTNALNYVIPNVMGGNIQPSKLVMPLATRALGGLMLFDGPLTEDPANIFFPDEAHLVAKAGQGINSANPYGGSRNAAESGALETGYRTVWDFNTAQANGSIRSLALTFYESQGTTGVYPLQGVSMYTTMHNLRRLNGDRSYDAAHALCYDVDEQAMYFIGDDGYSYTSTYDSNRRVYIYTYTMTVYKEHVPLSRYRVADEADMAGYPEEAAQITFTTEGSVYYDPRPYFRNGYDGYAYLVYLNGNSSGSGSFSYYRMKLSDYSFELEGPFTVPVASCTLEGGMASAIVNMGKCVLRGYNRRWLYVVDLSNTADVRAVYLGDDYWALGSYPMTNYRNGIIKFQMVSNSTSVSRYYFYDALLYTDGSVIRDAWYYEGTAQQVTNGHQKFDLITDDLMVYGLGYGSHGRLANNYLGTICNLGSAVIKTAAASMKVIYTLTDVDE